MHGEIPVRSFVVVSHICKIDHGIAKYLMLKRDGDYLHGIWQMVTGRIEKGESAPQAVLREIKEETNLVPDRLYSANITEIFYEPPDDCMVLAPVFIAFIDSDQTPKLSTEHSEYKWVAVNEASQMLAFDQQREILTKVDKNFLQTKPNELLRIEMEE